jgi:hypothetical protein
MPSILVFWRRALFISVWIALVLAGFWRLLDYSGTPGEAARTQLRWPAASSLVRSNSSTLVIFAHPHCPCSRATVGELERLMPHIHGKVAPRVVFFKPKDKSESWVKGALWKKAEAIPGVQTVLDEDGLEASRFGARTSGQTFLYDARGKLVFHGGITPERGHMGDSDGREAILQFAAIGETRISSTPAFGCSLEKPEPATAESQQ